jgi:hypothetical protein
MPWRAVALAGSLALLWAAPAGATTYCVDPATGCGGGDFSTLGAALTAASSNAGADDVQLGAANYMDGPWTYSDLTATNPVTIRGAGQRDSRLISASGGPTLSLTNGSADNVAVFAPVGGDAVSITAGTLSNSSVYVSTNGHGVNATGATIDHVGISPESGSSGHTAVVADTSTIKDSFISTTNGIDVVNPPVAVRRSTIVTKGYGFRSFWSDSSISDSQIVLNDPTAVGVEGICDLSVGNITIAATNLTVTGAGSGGIAFRSIGGQNCGGYVAASSSLVDNVGTTADCAPGIGTASVTVSYSDADLAGLGKVTGTCTGAVDAGNNFFADPKLASVATLQPVPRFDSPLVDAGDPSAPGADQPTDLPGLPRAVNGRRDVGAFEYGRRAPSLSVASSASAVMTTEPVTFTATTSDPDLGDDVTVAWGFDDGATASGTEATHAFATGGTHTATATATDSAGVTTVRAATVEVTTPAQITPPPGPGTTPAVTLVLDRLAIAPARFRALASGPGLIAAAAPRGATLSYRVSRTATVRLTAQRLVAGRRVGASCRKPSRKNRRAKRCTRAVRVPGSLADAAAAAGTRQLRFTGRIGGRRLAVGSYRLTARATSGTESSTATPVLFRIVRR